MHDLEAAYGDELGEASTYSADRVRLLGGKRSPIVVATILLAIGWTMLVLPTRSRDFQAALSAEIVLEAAEDRLGEARSNLEAAEEAVEANEFVAAGEEAENATAAAGQANDNAQQSAELSTEGTTATTDRSLPQPTPTSPGVGEDAVTGEGPADSSQAEATTSVEAARESVRTAEQAVTGARADFDEQQGGDFFQLLTPRPSVAAMAFLGAYFFAVYLVLRGYLRGDLRPKVYNQITARLVTVVVIAYLINAVVLVEGASGFWGKSVLAGAFVAGVIPRTFLRGFGDWALLHARPQQGGTATGTGGTKQSTSGLFARAFTERRLLTSIDGIDIYDRERLNSEGITDIEALAHADIIRLMVSSRLDIERLLDWVDQAVLQLHAIPPGTTDGKAGPVLTKLHDLGIRTGTDLLDVHERTRAGERDAIAMRNAITKALDVANGENASGAASYRLLVFQVSREPATRTLQHWTESPLGNPTEPGSFYDSRGRLQPVRSLQASKQAGGADGEPPGSVLHAVP
jgi:hypothetical protein